jgi:hypothetical protein
MNMIIEIRGADDHDRGGNHDNDHHQEVEDAGER